MMKVLVCELVLVLALVSVHSASLTRKELLEELLDNLLERDGPELDKRGAILAMRDGDKIRLYLQKQMTSGKTSCSDTQCPYSVSYISGIVDKPDPSSGEWTEREYFMQDKGNCGNLLENQRCFGTPVEITVDEGEDYTVVVKGTVSATMFQCQTGEQFCRSRSVNLGVRTNPMVSG